MIASGYVPDRGDLIWLLVSPQRGREEAGRRPALVLSPRRYNQRAGLAIACPISSRIKGYPFEVELGASGASLAPSWSTICAAWTGGAARPSGSATRRRQSWSR